MALAIASPEERDARAKQQAEEEAELLRLVEDLKAALRYLTVATKSFIKRPDKDSAGSIAIKEASERFRGAVADLRTFSGHEDDDSIPTPD